jgi:hypothetical protein
MSRIATSSTICFLLTGCPGGADRMPYDNYGWISVNKEKVCFSLDKKEILSSYHLSSNENGKPVTLLDSGRDEGHNLSYPNTCFQVDIKQGQQYTALYIINNIKYQYRFIVDNNWTVINLKGVN